MNKKLAGQSIVVWLGSALLGISCRETLADGAGTVPASMAGAAPVMALGSVPSSTATSSSPSDVCQSILAYGVFDTNDAYTTRDRYRLTKAAVCSSSFDSLAKAEAAKGNLGIDVFDIFGLSAGGSYNEATYHTAWSTFCGQSYDENASNDVVISHVKRASSVLTSAFSDCIQTTKSGFVFYVSPSANRSAFSVVLQNKGDGDPTFRVEKVTFTPPANVQCQGLPSIPYKTTNNFFTFACTKPEQQAVMVGVETNRGMVPQVEVPARTEVPPSMEQRMELVEKSFAGLLHVGTIVPFAGSLADAQAMQNDGWYVCDGQTKISDAKSPLNGQTTPDLRGRFLPGSKTNSPRETGGAENISVADQVVHVHTNGQFGAPQIYGPIPTHMMGPQTFNTDASFYSEGVWTGFTAAIVPQYFSVIYLIKAK